MEKEKTIIQRIICYSKVILALKLNKLQLTKAHEVANKIPVILFYKKHYKEMIDEIERRQFEINNQIKQLLKPLFQDIEFGYTEDGKWCLSQKEMQQGYVLLEHKCIYNEKGKLISGYQCILFLSDFESKNHKIIEGSIYPIGEVAPILGNLKDVFGEYQDISKYLYTSILNIEKKK
jgi:hypothetical protein